MNHASRETALKALVLSHVHDSVVRRRSRRLVIPAVALCAAVGGGAAYAATVHYTAPLTPDEIAEIEDGGEFPERVQADEALVQPVVDEILALTGQDTIESLNRTIDGQPSGFAALQVHSDRRTVELFWNGRIPPSIRAIVDAHPDVTIRIIPAECTRLEALQAAEIIGTHHADILATLGDRGVLTAWGPDAAGRGLFVEITSAAPDLTEDEVRGIIAEYTSVPIADVGLASDEGDVIELTDGTSPSP